MKRWKKLSVIIPVAMAAIMMFLSPASALAQSGEEAAPGPGPLGKGSLAIVAPAAAPVNTEISMTVFLRWNQEPFPDAGVWAFTREEADTFRQEIQDLRQSEGFNQDDADYESMADIHGRFLGRTDERGKLYQSFGEAGDYVLAAFHRGYLPGFSGLHIRELPDGLAIHAPDRARPGEEVSITVGRRGADEVVPGAGVWAITRDNAETLRDELSALRANEEIAAEDKDYESLVDLYGIYIGRTDDNGQVTYAFEEEGGYMLVAVLAGYFPGFKGIHIGEPPQALAIRAPEKARVNEDVTMMVGERESGTPVEGAGIWAITRDNVEAFRAELASLRESDVAPADLDLESTANAYGMFLDRTDENGQLTASFAEEGGYMLFTWKPGYMPGAAGIRIGDPIKGLAVQAPRRVQVGEEVPVTVVQRGDDPAAVEGAGVWAISLDNAEAVREEMAALRQDSSVAAADKDFESLAGAYGFFIGRTDENGQVIASFDEPGGYLLLAVKSGYFPGMAPIGVAAPRPERNKDDVLRERGVPGNGLDRAPGLQRPFNPNAPGAPGNGPSTDVPVAPDVTTNTTDA